MNEELPKIIQEAKAIAEDAQKIFGSLTTEQLNWKPNAESWSVAQCFEHLIVIDASYFPIMEKVARGEYKHSFKERLPILPRLFGKLIINAVKPETKRKLKAATNFAPSKSEIDGRIIEKFVKHQQEIIEHIKMTANVDVANFIITSPVASFVTYSLLDGYKVIVEHERRHMAQAERVIERMKDSERMKDEG